MTLFNDGSEYTPGQLIKCATGLYNSGIITMSQLKTMKAKIEIKFSVELGTKGLDFKIFWDCFDKKVGDIDAIKASWNLISPTLQQRIIDMLPDWKKQFMGKQYQPNPETFINGKRWNDEIIKSIEVIRKSSEERTAKIDTAQDSSKQFRDYMINGNGSI